MRHMLMAALLLTLAGSALADSVRCTTTYSRTLDLWHTLCDNGARGVTRHNKVLGRFETTITEPAKKACTGRMHPITKQVEVHCR
jgi:hypothetical protein